MQVRFQKKSECIYKIVYRTVNNKTPPSRIWGSEIFQRFLLFTKNLAKILSGFCYSQKKIACGGLLLFSKFLKLKFGPSGSRFFNKNAVFALKYPKKFSACGGLVSTCFYYSQKKKSPAAGFYYLQNFKIDLLLLFTQNPPKFSFCFYYFHVNGGVLIVTPRYSPTSRSPG